MKGQFVWTLMRELGYLLLACLAFPSGAATVEYIHTDALGSVVAVTDSTGTVIEQREYEPYGRQLKPTTVSDGPGYTGHASDAATEMIYMQQRYYDPEIGRFLSSDAMTAFDDPIRMFNRYKYAANNPYKFTDPDGRCETTTGSKICGGGAGNNLAIIPVNPPRSSSTNGGFTTSNAQSRFDGADRAVRSVRGKVGEIKHKTEDSAAQTFEHVFQPISSRFGVEIDAAIEGMLDGGFYLVDISVGREFRSDGIGYTVRGGFSADMTTIHSHPILSVGAKGYSPFSSPDLDWFRATSSPVHYVSDPGGLYRFNGAEVPITSVPRLQD